MELNRLTKNSYRRISLRVVASCGCARMASADDCPKETAGKARMHTCVDQYNAYKASNGNGGLKWIQKGGGYYCECTKKLKGAA